MKIKVGIVDGDKEYSEKIINAFTNLYNDKMEVFAYSDIKSFIGLRDKNSIDVVLISEDFSENLNLDDIGEFSFLTSSNQLEAINGKNTICKYQKIDAIYKSIVSIFSDKSNVDFVFKADNTSETKLIAFVSGSGGAGSATIAAAAAVNISKKGKKVLYINMKPFASVKPFFNAEGDFNFSDVLFSIKSKKSNLTLKIDSATKQDESGVYFFDDCNNSLDMAEMNLDDFTTLIKSVVKMGNYDYICLVAEGILEEKTRWLLNEAYSFVLVSTGKEISNIKTYKIIETLSIISKRLGKPLLSKIGIIYNIFSSKTGKYIQAPDIKIFGGVPTVIGATPKQIIEKISNNAMFDIFI